MKPVGSSTEIHHQVTNRMVLIEVQSVSTLQHLESLAMAVIVPQEIEYCSQCGRMVNKNMNRLCASVLEETAKYSDAFRIARIKRLAIIRTK